MSCTEHVTAVQKKSRQQSTALSSKVVKRLFSVYDTRQYLEKDACSNPGNLTAQMNWPHSRWMSRKVIYKKKLHIPTQEV